MDFWLLSKLFLQNNDNTVKYSMTEIFRSPKKDEDDRSLNTRSMIFTLYGDYIAHYGSKIWIGSLIRLLNEFGHNDQSVRAAISRMNKQGWVQAEKIGNKSYYSLTPRGQKRIDEAGKRIFKLKPEEWDGKWRILMYTIPEEIRNVRDELRKELIWSGFGSMSNSFWISANNLERQVNDLIDKYEINQYVDFFVAEYKGPHENQRLVEKSWDLQEINSKYQDFISEYSQKYIIDKTRSKRAACPTPNALWSVRSLYTNTGSSCSSIQVSQRSSSPKNGWAVMQQHFSVNTTKN